MLKSRWPLISDRCGRGRSRRPIDARRTRDAPHSRRGLLPRPRTDRQRRRL